MSRNNSLVHALFFGPSTVYHGLAAVILWASGAYFFCVLATVPVFLLMGLAQCIGGAIAVQLEGRSISMTHLWAATGRRAPLITLLFLNQLGYTYAFRAAPAAQVDLINYLWPTMLVCGESMRMRQGLSNRQVLGLVLGFGGVAYLVLPDLSGTSGVAYAPGYLAAFFAGLCWTAYSLMLRYYDEQALDDSGSGTAEDVLIAGLLCLGITAFDPSSWQLSGTELGLIILLGVTVFGCAFTFWRKGLQAGDPLLVGGMANFIPILSVVGLVIGGISPMSTRLFYAGFLVTVGCFCLGSTKQLEPEMA